MARPILSPWAWSVSSPVTVVTDVLALVTQSCPWPPPVTYGLAKCKTNSAPQRLEQSRGQGLGPLQLAGESHDSGNKWLCGGDWMNEWMTDYSLGVFNNILVSFWEKPRELSFGATSYSEAAFYTRAASYIFICSLIKGRQAFVFDFRPRSCPRWLLWTVYMCPLFFSRWPDYWERIQKETLQSVNTLPHNILNQRNQGPPRV